jgi:hypothetical protein
MKDLLSNLKENNQDFEFYPTTQKMVDIIKENVGHLLKCSNILDIGAGNGNFFTKLDLPCQKFAIEKSQILIDAMPNDVIVIGSDFHEQTLFDKDRIDYIFCNPPYSEFKDWMHKIIKEANCNNVIMIVPSRWKDDNDLMELINKRKFNYRILGNDNFLDSERQARAYVDIILFSRANRHNDDYGYDRVPRSFIDFFNEEFGINFTCEKDIKLDERMKNAEENEVVPAGNFVEMMVNLYTIEMGQLIDSYKAICKLSENTLKDIGVNKVKLTNSLWEKINKLKKEYWKHLIDRTDKITDRLIEKTRQNLLSIMTLSGKNDINFTAGNIYAVIIWIIKNANKSYDEQLLHMFDICIAPENIKNYKSNKKVFETEENCWGHGCGTKTRFKNDKDVNNVILDYRIITKKGSYYYYRSFGSQDNESYIIQDWETICNNLLGHKNFGEIKFFKNGNCHIKFNVEFAKAFNIQASLLKGWIKDKRQAKEEFEMDITEEDLNFSNFQINKNHFLLLD